MGSRYVTGSGVEDWPAVRLAISRVGSFASVRSKGYSFQIEMTYRVIENDFRVVEVPIVFRDRRVGNSKMDHWIVAEAAWRVPLLRVRGG